MHGYINSPSADYRVYSGKTASQLDYGTIFGIEGCMYLKTQDGIIGMDADCRLRSITPEMQDYVKNKVPRVIYGTLCIHPVG